MHSFLSPFSALGSPPGHRGRERLGQSPPGRFARAQQAPSRAPRQEAQLHEMSERAPRALALARAWSRRSCSQVSLALCPPPPRAIWGPSPPSPLLSPPAQRPFLPPCCLSTLAGWVFPATALQTTSPAKGRGGRRRARRARKRGQTPGCPRRGLGEVRGAAEPGASRSGPLPGLGLNRPAQPFAGPVLMTVDRPQRLPG